MSDVELLFKRLQEQLGGSLTWHQLSQEYQHVFIQSVNNIRGICSLQQGQ